RFAVRKTRSLADGNSPLRGGGRAPVSPNCCSRKVVLVAAALTLLSLGVAAYFFTQKKSKESDQDNLAFREGARESGITFRMNFLSGEQGENFKVNLY